MKLLLAACMTLALAACASDVNSQRLIEVGESCAKIGKFMHLPDAASTSQPPSFWESYPSPDSQPRCR